tara:strand:+ start:1696 stop:4896 length:3201 start_codon:yes stop_codon:yes gene_type:complete
MKNKTTLGLDLGQSSIGWALLKNNNFSNEPCELIDWGVRIFPDGRDAKSNQPLAVERREKRCSRRRRDRALARQRELIRILTLHGLFPVDQKDQQELKYENPYKLRALAVREKLSLFEVGRALVHICKHRGFKSNRKIDRNDLDESSGMKVGISKLKKTLNGKTLGEFLFERYQNGEWTRFRPTSNKSGKNIWDLGYPDRSMYEAEIEKIWDFQKKHYDELTPELLVKVHHIIINQRPLKPQPVGRCTFEYKAVGKAGERAPLSISLVQQFRVWQEVNNLELETLNGKQSLSKDELNLIASHLLCTQKGKSMVNTKGTLLFKTIRKKILNLESDCPFNLESAGRDGLKADTTARQLSHSNCFGEAWFQLSEKKQTEIVQLIRDEPEEEPLLQYFIDNYSMTKNNAKQISSIRIADGHAKLSLLAIRKILPYLQAGFRYHEACQKAGYHHSARNPEMIYDELPYYGEVLEDVVIPPQDRSKYDREKEPEKYWGKINNPTVHLGLNQLRKIINAIINKYGKPDCIVIELARDLKRTEKQKKQYKDFQRKNTLQNQKIDSELDKLGIKKNRENRQCFKLWEELSTNPAARCCPFSREPIAIHQLFSPEVEIEHLLPFSQTFDDSMANKTVCFRHANRKKGNRTPYEAFYGSDEWASIMSHAMQLPKNKRWRFEADAMNRFAESGDGIARLLNDTRYLSKVAHQYLNTIVAKVNVVTGQMTAILRRSWGLNHILSDGVKNRDDNRHHAIDAFTVACTTTRFLQKLSSTAQKVREMELGKPDEIFANMPSPWDHFNPDKLKDSAQRIVVSYKPDHGLKIGRKNDRNNSQISISPLHEETNYGLISQGKKDKVIVANRVELQSIKKAEKNIKEIADQRVQKSLMDANRVITSDKEWQTFLSEYTVKTGIRRVRIHREKDIRTMRKITHKDQAGKEHFKYVATGGNFCADIYVPLFGEKKGKWRSEIISNFDAHQRGFTPNWKKEYPTARKIMTLQISDMVELEINGVSDLYKVKKMRQDGRVYFRAHQIAREKGDELTLALPASKLQQYKAKKASVDILGKVQSRAVKVKIS